jgi:hypothetical protein
MSAATLVARSPANPSPARAAVPAPRHERLVPARAAAGPQLSTPAPSTSRAARPIPNVAPTPRDDAAVRHAPRVSGTSMPNTSNSPRSPYAPSRPASASTSAAPTAAARSASTRHSPDCSPAASRVPVAPPGAPARPANEKPREEHPVLKQAYFKSVGPRTYAFQIKMATNGNHYVTLIEGRRDKQSGEVRKNQLNVFSEDFDAFFALLREAAAYIRDNPLPPDFVAKRKRFWANIAKRSVKSHTEGNQSPKRPARSDGGRSPFKGSRPAPVS